MQSNMGAPVLAVDYDGRGIGYSVFFYARFMHPASSVKLLGVDGVLPTSTTIAERSYPLVTKVFAVVRDDMPADSTAILLRDWLLTPDGQAAVAASGYVPLLKP
jgi:ABC-type phosphate transport system substrate-binding protein